MNFKWILGNSHKYTSKTVNGECFSASYEDRISVSLQWRCCETTALGIRDQTDRCKTYQDWKTLWDRFDRDIYSLPATAENSSPLGHMYFELNIFLKPTHPSYCALTGIKPSYTCRLDLSQKHPKTKYAVTEFWVQSSFYILKHQNITGVRPQQLGEYYVSSTSVQGCACYHRNRLDIF